MKTSQQVANLGRVKRITAIMWARNNGVKKFGRDYGFTDEDIRRFMARNREFGPRRAKS